MLDFKKRLLVQQTPLAVAYAATGILVLALNEDEDPYETVSAFCRNLYLPEEVIKKLLGDALTECGLPVPIDNMIPGPGLWYSVVSAKFLFQMQKMTFATEIDAIVGSSSVEEAWEKAELALSAVVGDSQKVSRAADTLAEVLLPYMPDDSVIA